MGSMGHGVSPGEVILDPRYPSKQQDRDSGMAGELPDSESQINSSTTTLQMIVSTKEVIFL